MIDRRCSAEVERVGARGRRISAEGVRPDGGGGDAPSGRKVLVGDLPARGGGRLERRRPVCREELLRRAALDRRAAAGLGARTRPWIWTASSVSILRWRRILPLLQGPRRRRSFTRSGAPTRPARISTRRTSWSRARPASRRRPTASSAAQSPGSRRKGPLPCGPFRSRRPARAFSPARAGASAMAQRRAVRHPRRRRDARRLGVLRVHVCRGRRAGALGRHREGVLRRRADPEVVRPNEDRAGERRGRIPTARSASA